MCNSQLGGKLAQFSWLAAKGTCSHPNHLCRLHALSSGGRGVCAHDDVVCQGVQNVLGMPLSKYMNHKRIIVIEIEEIEIEEENGHYDHDLFFFISLPLWKKSE